MACYGCHYGLDDFGVRVELLSLRIREVKWD